MLIFATTDTLHPCVLSCQPTCAAQTGRASRWRWGRIQYGGVEAPRSSTRVVRGSGSEGRVGRAGGDRVVALEAVEIVDMRPEHAYYVATCTHVNESPEIDACGARRLAWFDSASPKGLTVKVAAGLRGPVGFAYGMPAELSPWGPMGSGFWVIPCLVVSAGAKGQGVGRMLVEAVEETARSRGAVAVVVPAFTWDFWFMPASYFERLGYRCAARRGQEAAMARALGREGARLPDIRLLEPNPRFEPVAGRVAIDLFYNSFCQTSDIEAQRVREVAAEFGEAVLLREHCADQRPILEKYQIARGIFVNGTEIGWGCEAPRDGIRDAIRWALAAGGPGEGVG